MNEPKFTQGEWLKVEGESFVYALNDYDVNHFSLSLQGNSKVGALSEELEANAHLIKTSPKLYNMLDRVLKETPDSWLNDKDYKLRQDITTLLSEARGGL